MIVKDIRSLLWIESLLEVELREMVEAGVTNEFIEYKHAEDWLKELELRKLEWTKHTRSLL